MFKWQFPTIVGVRGKLASDSVADLSKVIKPPLSIEAKRTDFSFPGEKTQGSSRFRDFSPGDRGSEQDSNPSREGKCDMESTQQA